MIGKMEITQEKICNIQPYKRNAKKHPKKQVQRIMNSIEEFGMCDPIAVWGKENIVIEGHGRLMALKELGYEEVPVIRLDYLTDEQRRAYTLAHNKTAESEWDFELLDEEINDILNINMEDYGFEFVDAEDSETATQSEEKQNERVRTTDAYNLAEFNKEESAGYYQMPVIKATDYVPDDLIGFNYMLTADNFDCGVHFYIDDYQFERIWNQPQLYLDRISDFRCMLTPDFSLYTEMPIAMKIWNVYRSRLIGQMAQATGIEVIPTVSWAEKETFDFCFDGLPKHSTLSISTIGVKTKDYNFNLWKNGVDEMIKRLEPKTLLIYGGKVDYDYGSIKTVYYTNKVTEHMKRGEENGR